MAFEYYDVKKDAAAMRQMLEHSRGGRQVPVIVSPDGVVTVGFGGT